MYPFRFSISEKIIRHLLGFLVFVSLLTALLLPRLSELNRFATPDEWLWLNRSANFYYALGQRDFESTYQIYHPGVTVMWAGTFGFLARLPEHKGTGVGQLDRIEFDEYLANEMHTKPIDLLVAARIFIVIGHIIILLLSYLYICRLISPLVAFVALILIALDPFHIALSRVLHLDALLANLLLLSMLSLISYLDRGNIFDLIISGMAAGFSWLTKSPGFLIIPVAIVALRIRAIRSVSTGLDSSGRYQIKLFEYPILIWGVAGLLTFFLFWPALWIDPLNTILKILQWVGAEAAFGHEWPIFFNGQIYKSGSLGLSSFYFYPLTFLWRTTPIVLIGLLFVLIGYFQKWRPFDQKRVRLTIFGLFLFCFIFTVAISLIGKKFDRYYLAVYAPLDILAALGWASIIYWIQERISSRFRWFIIPAVLLSLIGIQLIPVIRTAPYYFSYYNPVLGGSKKAPEVMLIGWGEGLDEAARYLNLKEDARELNVTSWWSQGSFSYFFNGTSFNLHPGTTRNDNKEWNSLISSDYVVSYVFHWQRNLPAEVLEYLENFAPEHTIWIDGIEYARIYKIN